MLWIVFLDLDGPGYGLSIEIAGLVRRFARLVPLGHEKDDRMSCQSVPKSAVSWQKRSVPSIVSHRLFPSRPAPYVSRLGWVCCVAITGGAEGDYPKRNVIMNTFFRR